ncbi:PAS domain-containing hybrid sensor histidine kinase/response regulator [Hymenobacter negativus]|uniref:histidine kinase n=1 Tax=Hymenobacter negativus TaxID=2795026 RepID=A0ABS0Q637_9BACT|nr:PAS domain-containing hybrid sensor histidine kinase/response regulator [Hymenobacter negativus]MBH8558047.1 PAS domain S-box protein [Hymenobacter negativus]
MRRSRYPRLARRTAVPAARRVAERTMQLPTPTGSTARQNAGPPAQVLADRVPLILFSYDLRHRKLVHCNRHCHSVLGYSAQMLLDLGPGLTQHVLHPDSLAQLLKSDVRQLLARNKKATWDCRVRHHDGSWRLLRLQVQASVLGPEGQVWEIMGSAEDVTRHRAAVDELRQSRHLLRQVLDVVPNLVAVFDLHQQRPTYANRRIETLLGYTSHEIMAFPPGGLLPHLLPPDSLARYTATMQAMAQLPEGQMKTIEFPARHRDGSIRWLHSTLAAFGRDANGLTSSILSVTDDITEQRAADEQHRLATTRLTEQHRLFRQVIDALPHPIYLKDEHGNYLLANRALAALYDLTPDELVRAGKPDIPITADTARYRQQDLHVLTTGQDLTLEESFTNPDGRIEWFSSVKRLFVQDDGTAQVLGVDSNITELKSTQQALESAIATAQVDAQAKEDFLANMSHEIRTPLHGILGLTGVLVKTTLSRSQHDYLRLLGESAEHLLNVLNDVLTTARLGAGKLQPEAMPFAPSELLRGCAALLRPRAREKGLRLRIEKPTLAVQVLGDAHRLRQVLLNLVSNAIKFTETGTIRLRCRVVPAPRQHTEPAGTVWLQFMVSDTGLGIAPDTLDKIFEPFTQATASTDREYGGTGLGLSISEGLVKLMGGALRVCSEVDQGSTFAFILAFQPVATASSVPAETPAEAVPLAEAGRILLVEDNLVNSLLAETVLRNWGWQVTTAASGPAAIKLFEHRTFDLVLMDIQMPGMDGEMAARALREHPDPNQAATPVIALTARAQVGEAERLQASGFAGYLAKPYREEQLLETMHAVLASHRQVSEPAPTYHTTPSMASAPPLYNLSNVRQLVRNDETIVRRLAWAFIETTPAILTALDEALTKADWEALGDAAHHLKSSLDGLGVESLRHVIREAEAYGETPPAPAHAAQQVTLIRTVTEQVMASLRTEFPEQQA